jgi:hypothetical protein
MSSGLYDSHKPRQSTEMCKLSKELFCNYWENCLNVSWETSLRSASLNMYKQVATAALDPSLISRQPVFMCGAVASLVASRLLQAIS